MLNRRNLLLSAAVLPVVMAAPALAADEPKLPRQQVDLVAPPFVHAHMDQQLLRAECARRYRQSPLEDSQLRRAYR
jgi:hypothetical protein